MKSARRQPPAGTQLTRAVDIDSTACSARLSIRNGRAVCPVLDVIAERSDELILAVTDCSTCSATWLQPDPGDPGNGSILGTTHNQSPVCARHLATQHSNIGSASAELDCFH
jgi:hypothetical protein